MTKLRKSARDCPRCMSCGIENNDPEHGILALAHSNALQDGRGAYHKSPDIYGAIVCMKCHDRLDGRVGGWNKEHKREEHEQAWIETMRWWIEEGYVGVK